MARTVPVTPRPRMLADLTKATGHRVALTNHIDAWLKTHAVFVASMLAAIDQCSGDSVSLAENRSAVTTTTLATCSSGGLMKTCT